MARRWHSRPRTLWRTMLRTFGSLRAYRLGALSPLFVLLVLTAALLWMINAIAPLAPFVYSLF